MEITNVQEVQNRNILTAAITFKHQYVMLRRNCYGYGVMQKWQALHQYANSQD